MKTSSAPPAGGGSPLLGIVAAGLGVLALGAAVVLSVQLGHARAEIAGLQKQLQELSASTDKRTKDLDMGVAEVRAQTSSVAEKVGVTAADLERTAATARQLEEEQRKGKASLASLGGEVGKVKDDVAASKAAIEETQAKLQRAMGDLGEQSGLIARNAEELATLKKTNLRDYFEFDLRKTKQAAPVGVVAIRLKDADPKRHKFNMVLVVDDLEIEKKDKTLLEPVQFYRKGSRQLHEIVVYAVEKDRITGYLSTPKASEAAAAK
jgi:hypothetical protein